MSDTMKSKRSDSISELDLASIHNSEHRGPQQPPKVMGEKNQTSSNMFPEISTRRQNLMDASINSGFSNSGKQQRYGGSANNREVGEDI